MRSIHSQQFARVGFPDLLRQFGEPISYRFRSGDAVQVVAIVDREPNQRYDMRGNVYQPAYEVQIKHSEVGVIANRVDAGGDTVELTDWQSELPVTATVTQIISIDSGVIHLALR
jgi:hypothetical protein